MFGGSAKKLYNNIVVSDDEEDEDEPEVDELFLNGDNEDVLPDFENEEPLPEGRRRGGITLPGKIP